MQLQILLSFVMAFDRGLDNRENEAMSITESFITDIAHLLRKDSSDTIVKAIAEKAIEGAGMKKDQRIDDFEAFIQDEIPPGTPDGMDVLEFMISMTHLYRAKYQ